MNSADQIQLWIKSVGYSHSDSKRTEGNYKLTFPKYCEFIGQTTEQITQDYENAEQNHTSERTVMRRHTEKIKLWLMELENKKQTPATIRTAIGIVMSFYNYNDLAYERYPCQNSK